MRILPKTTLAHLADPEALDTILRFAFSGRRKTLRNALKTLELDWSSIAVEQSARPDGIGVAEYLALANAFTAQHGVGAQRTCETAHRPAG